MLHPVEKTCVDLASKLGHDRITELHVLVAWLQQDEAPKINDKDTIRVNGHILLRELLASGEVERSSSNRLSLTDGARFWLERIAEHPHDVDALQELVEQLGLESGNVVPRKKLTKDPHGKAMGGGAEPADDSMDKILAELDALVGLTSVKERVRTLVQQQLVNQKMKERGAKPPATGMNLVFSGNPGTGKTTVARIISRVYKQLGLLSKGHLVEVGRDDLVAQHVGGTAKLTKNQINRAIGGTLFIDEAYSLATDRGADYGAEAISTLVAAMENRRDELAVIVAGYTGPMLEFMKMNPGLESRFTATIHFEDYSNDELVEIFGQIAKEHDIAVTDEVNVAVLRHVSRNRTSGDGGNARYVRKLFLRMYELLSLRAAADGVIEDHEIEAFVVDDVPDNLEFGSAALPIDEVLAELDSLVGIDDIKSKVRALVERVKARVVADAHGKPTVDMNLNLIFAGDPGTGKTTIARILAKAYRALGVLPRGQLVEVGRQDLVAAYVGQTALKTKSKIDEAMGGVLFIDEAYSLTTGGGTAHDYGREALTTLVQEMENHRGHFAVIAAGYRQDMEFFVEANPGLASRFDEHIVFPNYSREELLSIFLDLAGEKQIDVSEDVREAVAGHLSRNTTSGVNGNGRYIRKLFEKMYDNLVVRLAGDLSSPEALFHFEVVDVPDKLATDHKPRIGFG